MHLYQVQSKNTHKSPNKSPNLSTCYCFLIIHQSVAFTLYITGIRVKCKNSAVWCITYIKFYILQRHWITALFPKDAAQWRGVFWLSSLSIRFTSTPEANSWQTLPNLQWKLLWYFHFNKQIWHEYTYTCTSKVTQKWCICTSVKRG